MPNYRRAFTPGGCWFFTVNLHDREATHLTDHIEALRASIRQTLERHPFHIDAFVVLPDHIHAVWTLPTGDTNFPKRWGLLKSSFSRALSASPSLNSSQAARGERGIWQRRFWEHAIRDERDHQRHVEYCLINPVKHGYVRRVADWPHSTFHRDVRAGVFSADWAGEFDDTGAFGERRVR